MKTIDISGVSILLDDDDHDALSGHRWHINAYGYAARNVTIAKCKKTILYMHRVIMNAPKGLEVDHINGIKTDNRKCNLRIATRMQNSINIAKYQTGIYSSKFKGVTLDKNSVKKPWRAHITVNKKMLHLGCFDTEIEAALAYNSAAAKYHGEFANLNEILGA